MRWCQCVVVHQACVSLCPCVLLLGVLPQLYTQVEAFSSAISKLQELGLKVNVEECELVYRGTAGASSGWRNRSGSA